MSKAAQTKLSGASPAEPEGFAATLGSEIPWSEIDAFVRKLVSEDRGKRRAANLIREIAVQLAGVEACEDLANAAQEVTRALVRAWENRWERERSAGESQNGPMSSAGGAKH